MVADLAFFRATMPESSALATGSDDALKDLDNTWFLRGQPEDVRQAWFERAAWLRMADRLAENEHVEPERHRFAYFIASWRHLLRTWHAIGDETRVARGLWLVGDGDRVRDNAWALTVYLEALEAHGLRGVTPRTLVEHSVMLERTSGSMFQLFPYVADELLNSIWHFGALDHFFNNLRDLAEDSAAGLCYFPEDVLREHGLTRDDVLTGRCIGTVGWEQMMRFWLDDYLPTLRNAAQPFIDATGLHPSLEALREWCLHRYRRTESVFRQVGYDYRAFDVLYWDSVRLELTERSEAA